MFDYRMQSACERESSHVRLARVSKWLNPLSTPDAMQASGVLRNDTIERLCVGSRDLCCATAKLNPPLFAP